LKDKASEKVDEAKDKAHEVGADAKDKGEGKLILYIKPTSSNILFYQQK
jgi:hypothetical protein